MRTPITYEKLQAQDIFKIKRWRNSQISILRQNSYLTNEDQKRWWEHIGKNQTLLSIKENGNLIGYCGLVHMDAHNKKAEVSFLLNPSITKRKHNRLYGECLEVLISFGFKKLGLNRLSIEAFSNRKDIFSVITASGFEPEGVLRKSVLKNGVYLDSHLFGLLNKAEG